MPALSKSRVSRLLLMAALAAPAATTTAFSAMVTATQHSCSLSNTGAVHCWGSNRFGALGLSAPTTQATPLAVNTLPGPVTSASAGGDHTCAVIGGGAYCWGDNRYWQLGNGSNTDSAVPVPVSGLSSGVASVAVSTFYSCAVTTGGAVWCWGGGGQSGGPVDLSRTPRAMPGLGSGVASLAAGLGHACALTTAGAVLCWGANSRGQLGNGSTTASSTPVAVTGLGSGVRSLAASDFGTCAVNAAGGAVCWGENPYGELGNGTTTSSPVPVPVSGLASGVARVSAGYRHFCAVTQSGAAFCWGDGSYAQLGNGQLTGSLVPVAVTGLSSGVARVSSGPFFNCAVLASGAVTCWGYNPAGQIGNGTINNYVSAPVAVAGLASGFAGVVAGDNHACAVSNSGGMACWGDASSGALGVDTAVNSTTPVSVGSLPANLRSIAAGDRHACVLNTSGSVACWGADYFGQLGRGAPTLSAPYSRPEPGLVTSLPAAASISAGGSTTCAVTTAGAAYCWGGNSDGQVGNGQSGSGQIVATPAPVSGLASGVAQVSTGGETTCALGVNGAVSCWGSGYAPTPSAVPGLSSGVTAISVGYGAACAIASGGAVRCWFLAPGQVPAVIPGLASGAQAVSAGLAHACAINAAGNVVCWGSNQHGQLGDGTTTDRTTPVAVAGLPGNIVGITAGFAHTCATAAAGLVFCWGRSINGELGDGTLASRSRPVIVLREGAQGSLAAGDWFHDVNPGVGKTLPADRIPPFLIAASGNYTTTLSATTRFRSQDVGRSFRLFAYAPAGIVRSAKSSPGAGGEKILKDDATCVLAQLTSSGLEQVSASGLAVAGSVLSSLGQTVAVLNSASTSQVAGATFCVGTGTTGAEAVDPANSQCVVTVPGTSSSTTCLAPSTVTANAPGSLSGLWWNANESGWGIHFTQRAGNIFAAWYTYDGAGNPKWYVASNCAGMTGTAGTCSGPLYEVNGPVFFGAAFNPSAARVTTAGSIQVAFQDANVASMSYTVGGQSRTVAITRQAFATGPIPGTDYTDLWWNPAESGWGLAIAQLASNIFLAWYVYDGAGRPVWYVVPNCPATGSGCTGAIYRTTGPPFGPGFNPAQVQAFAVGTATLNYSDANNGTLSYTVDGLSSSKAITRQLF